MVEPMRRDLDRAVEDSMDMFSRARVGSVAPVEPIRPQSVLLGLDGSSQDGFGLSVAGQFGARFGSKLAIVDAREGEVRDDLAVEAARSLGAAAMPRTEGDSFTQLLAAADASNCDLLIVPSPFGRDLEAVGPDSVGTVIDVLLARSPVPILVCRKPYELHGDVFEQIVMALTAENEVAPVAAAWAAGLTVPRGVLHLVLVLEREMYENVQALMQSIAPDMDVSVDSLSHALARNYMQLHRALQKTAKEVGFEYKLHLQVEGEAAAIAKEDARQPTLRVLALERNDHVSEGTVHARVRQSLHPVLVVCGQRYERSPTTE